VKSEELGNSSQIVVHPLLRFTLHVFTLHLLGEGVATTENMVGRAAAKGEASNSIDTRKREPGGVCGISRRRLKRGRGEARVPALQSKHAYRPTHRLFKKAQMQGGEGWDD
jgi:hypothetical protein